MNWPHTKQTANAGVLFVQSVVNEHGSIFHPVHQENDVGVDGFIELVNVGEASGRLVAVQVKSGDSYRSPCGRAFRVYCNDDHLEYWESYMVPVIMVCFSPTSKASAWVSIRDYLERERYHERLPITHVEVPDYHTFSAEEIGKGIAALAHARADERLLIRCADDCLSDNARTRREAFHILSAHPDSRELRLAALMARQFILDDDQETARRALFALGFATGRNRWSWNPNNKAEKSVMAFASKLCSTLTNAEIQRLIELSDEGPFNGPTGLGERCFDILCCCFERAERVLDQVLADPTAPMERRANALLMLNGGSFDQVLEASEYLLAQDDTKDVLIAMFGSEEQVRKEASRL